MNEPEASLDFYQMLADLSKEHGLCLKFNYRNETVEVSKYIDTYESYEQCYYSLKKMYETDDE